MVEAIFSDLMDPLEPARERGRAARRLLLDAGGGALGEEQAAELLGIAPGSVNELWRAGTLLAIPTDGDNRYPSWQFRDGQVLYGLDLVLVDLRGHDPWSKLIFFVNGNLRLNGESPLDELRRGNIAAVRRAARAYGEQGVA